MSRHVVYHFFDIWLKRIREPVSNFLRVDHGTRYVIRLLFMTWEKAYPSIVLHMHYWDSVVGTTMAKDNQ